MSPEKRSLGERKENNPNRHIFISYARTDGMSIAKRIYDNLKPEYPNMVWWDLTKMHSGNFRQQIEKAVRASDTLILVTTSGSLASKSVQEEWELATAKGVRVLPVFASDTDDPTTNPLFRQLPKHIRDSHFYNLTISQQWEAFQQELKKPRKLEPAPYLVEPLPPSHIFRTKELTKAIGYIYDSKTADPISSTFILHGAGGAGKTTFARALAQQKEIRNAYSDGIVEIEIGDEAPNGLIDKQKKTNEQRVLAGLQTIYDAFTPSNRTKFSSVQKAQEAVRQMLRSKHALILVDNVWNEAYLKSFLNLAPGVTTIVTTRNRKLTQSMGRKSMELGRMSQREAIALLGKGIPTIGLREIANRLCYWPLTLELANAYIRREIKMGAPVQRILSTMNQKLTEFGIVAFDERNTGKDFDFNRNKAFEASMKLTMELLTPREYSLSVQLGLLAPGMPAPTEFIREAIWKTSQKETENVLNMLNDLSLIQFSRKYQKNGIVMSNSGNLISLHDVIKSYFQHKNRNNKELHQQIFHYLETDFSRKLEIIRLYSALSFEYYRAKSLFPNLADSEIIKFSTETEKADPFIRARISPDGTSALFASRHGHLVLYDLLEPEAKRRTLDHQLEITYRATGKKGIPTGNFPIAVHPYGKFFVTHFHDNFFVIVDRKTKEPVPIAIEKNPGAASALVITPNSALIVGCFDGKIFSVNMRTGKVLNPAMHRHRHPITSMTLNHDNHYLLSLDTSGKIYIWNLLNNECVGEGQNPLSSRDEAKIIAIDKYDNIATGTTSGNIFINGTPYADQINLKYKANDQINSLSWLDSYNLVATLGNGELINLEISWESRTVKKSFVLSAKDKKLVILSTHVIPSIQPNKLIIKTAVSNGTIDYVKTNK